MPFVDQGGGSTGPTPTWDGHPKGWRRYAREVSWYVQGTKHGQRRYLATRLISKLTGSARLLAMSWPQAEFDSEQGVLIFLRRLAQSPLVRRSLPNAAAIMTQYFQFKRMPGEPITNFLVRETLGFEEFQEALLRLREERLGLTVDKQVFGLESLLRGYDEEEKGSEKGNGSRDHAGRDEEWQPDSASVQADHPTPQGSQTGASPGHGAQPSGDGSGTPAPAAAAASAHKLFDTRSAVMQTEEESYDTFILDVLRGWRLLQAASLSLEKRRDVLSATHNKLDFESISNALQVLWDEQLSGARRMNAGHHGGHNSFYSQETDWPMDAMWAQESTWQGESDGWDEWFGYCGEDEWPEQPPPEAAEDLSHAELDDPAIREALQAEHAAETMAAEAALTWKRAQKATSELRRDRGFGVVKGKGKPPSFPGCYRCGKPGHLSRDCPNAAGGKGKTQFYIGEDTEPYYDPYQEYEAYGMTGKGKGKSFKGKNQFAVGKGAAWKGKGRMPAYRPQHPAVNAYGLEMMGIAGDPLDLNAASKSDNISPGGGLLDCGATASAGPEASVQRLIAAVLEKDHAATVTVDQSRRPYFCYGSGSWGRALQHVEIQSKASGNPKVFEVFALPNPPEYVEKWFRPEMLVPILVGMSHMGPRGAGMIVDFNDGYFVNATDQELRDKDQYMSTTSKGHYVADIVDYLTAGQQCTEGHCNVVIKKDSFRSHALPGTSEDLPIQLMCPLEFMGVTSVVCADQHAKSRRMIIHSAWARHQPSSSVDLEGSRMIQPSPLPNSDSNFFADNLESHGTQEGIEPGASLGREQGNVHVGSNRYGMWEECEVCALRLKYTPREGAPSSDTKVENAVTVQRAMALLREDLKDGKPDRELVKVALEMEYAKNRYEQLLRRRGVIPVAKSTVGTPPKIDEKGKDVTPGPARETAGYGDMENPNHHEMEDGVVGKPIPGTATSSPSTASWDHVNPATPQ
ncbi:unnamed protein product [Symbiodinium sp. CCMP2592]|nr:unnamed protein product [Symbiodinium sp. CCMP2592]